MLLTILGHLTRVADVAAARAVCVRWRAAVDGCGGLWRGLRLPLVRRRHVRAAESWYRRAARYGNAQAAAHLALLYSYGYRCACHGGHGDAAAAFFAARMGLVGGGGVRVAS